MVIWACSISSPGGMHYTTAMSLMSKCHFDVILLKSTATILAAAMFVGIRTTASASLAGAATVVDSTWRWPCTWPNAVDWPTPSPRCWSHPASSSVCSALAGDWQPVSSIHSPVKLRGKPNDLWLRHLAWWYLCCVDPSASAEACPLMLS